VYDETQKGGEHGTFFLSKKMHMCPYIIERVDVVDVCSVGVNVKLLHAGTALFTHQQWTS